MSDSVRPHRRQPTRLPCPWGSPGKNTGVGCHFLLQCMKVKSESAVTQSCPTLSEPMDCSPPGSSVHGIFQARVLEWGAIAFSGSLALTSSIFSYFTYTFLKKQISFQKYTFFYVRFTEKAMAPYSSTLARKIPWMEEPGGLQSMGSLRVGHD